jgi:hypothetical protein
MKYLLAAVVMCAALCSPIPLNAGGSIQLTVYPTITVAHGDAQLKIFVERNDENRALNWEVDGPDYYRSSTAQLDGADAPRSWFFLVKDLPEGSYQVRATVRRSNNSESVALAQMTVIGGIRH